MAYNFLAAGLAGIALLAILKLLPILSTAWNGKLARIPNAHWSVPYTKLWLAWQKGHGREFSARKAAHDKYGDIVRVAPNDVSVNCIEGGIKAAWGNWDKAGFYASFEYLGQHPLFSMVEAKPHGVRKKMLTGVYTKSFIDNSPVVAQIIKIMNEDRLLPLLRAKAAAKTSVEALWLSTSYFMDATTAFLYGFHNSSNFIQNEEESKGLLDAFETSLGPDTFWLIEFPFITSMLAKIGVNLVPAKVFQCFPVYEGFGFGLGAKAFSSSKIEKHEGLYSKPVVFDHFREKVLQAGTSGKEAETLIAAELLDHLHAAHEASGILVTYLFYELSKHLPIQDELIEELRQLKAAGKPTESSQLLEDLLLETMRIHPPANGPFPRAAPAAGGKIGGFDIPGGVEVSATPWTLGRNPKVFPNPEKWDPKRWPHATPEARKEMQQWVWIFGSGARVCIGKYFADLTIKSMITALYTNFRTELANPNADMTHTQAMMAVPLGHELKLTLKPL